jgi:L-lactate dehydrogenase complex protein LldF
MRDSVTGATLHFDRQRRRAWAEIDAAAWRRWAEAVKNHTLGHLDAYLEQAEARLLAHGAIVTDLARRRGVRRAVKAKSMLAEELGINPALEAAGVEVFETDLGERIVQLAGEPPSHIVGPAIHKSLEEIRRLFGERLGTPPDASPEALAARAREVLREAFLCAGMGISGGNFLVAETGTLALIENEGNIRLTTSAPPLHVALVGLEKLIPRFSDLALLLQLTSRAATGQPVGTYVSLIHGPRRSGDPDGPEEVHVVLVDNGRTGLLADPEIWEALRCLRCGACLNACPVFRQTGGHPYGWAYSGPIGAVLAPALAGLAEAAPLPFASSLCGACEEVCPVGIPLPRMLLAWRRRAVAAGLGGAGEKALLGLYTRVMTRPRLYRWASRLLRRLPGLLSSPWLPGVRAWARQRGGLQPSPRSFHELWREGLE